MVNGHANPHFGKDCTQMANILEYNNKVYKIFLFYIFNTFDMFSIFNVFDIIDVFGIFREFYIFYICHTVGFVFTISAEYK